MTSETELFDPRFLGRLRALFFKLRKRRQLRKKGVQSTPAAGFTREFKDHRRYVAGDDFRGIDWRLFARLERQSNRPSSADQHSMPSGIARKMRAAFT